MSYTNNKYRVSVRLSAMAGVLLWMIATAGIANDISGGEQNCLPSGTLGDIATLALIQKKPEISNKDFFLYWRDIHGLLAVRIPGFWTYTQYHLGDVITQLSRGSSSDKRSIERMHGFAEVTYCNASDIAGLATSNVTELIKKDEQNAFLSTYLYGTEQGNSVTLRQAKVTRPLVDRDKGAIILLVAKALNESTRAFGQHIADVMSNLPEQCPGVEFIRTHLFSPYQADAWTAPNVNHQPTVIYDAALEFKFPDRGSAIACIARSALPVLDGHTEAEQRHTVAFSVSARYQMVKDGVPTLLGLRGLAVYQLIQSLGAENQGSVEILNILYGVSGEK